jgi:hypothetical protein
MLSTGWGHALILAAEERRFVRPPRRSSERPRNLRGCVESDGLAGSSTPTKAWANA